MEVEKNFSHFDHIVVRFVMAVLLVMGALKVTLPVVFEVTQLVLSAIRNGFF